MTITRSLILAMTWLALAGLLAYTLAFAPVLLALAGIATVWGVHKASQAGPREPIAPDRPLAYKLAIGLQAGETLPEGFMAKYKLTLDKGRKGV